MARMTLSREDGYVLVVALMIMAILSLIGIAGLQTSRFEEEVAGNSWNAKRTFYMADGGLSVASELMEQNINCAPGFSTSSILDKFYINTLTLYQNKDIDPDLTGDPESSESEDGKKIVGRTADADVIYQWDGNGTVPSQDIGYFYLGGVTQILPGASLQMAAGYEGKGKSAAQGGVAKVYDIYSQYLGFKKSESIILGGWRHVVGQEGQCINWSTW